MNVIEVTKDNIKEEIATQILQALPDWFGIPEATQMYINESKSMPFFAVYEEEAPVGFIAMKENNSYTAEIYVMGVLPNHHRRGIGKALCDMIKLWAQQKEYEYLQVKTLDESHPDIHYAKTRQFYASMGYKPLECIPELWGRENPCLIMIQHIGS